MQLTRRNLALAVLAAVLASSLATVLATALIRSPAEVAARAAAPDASPILVPVEERVIETRVVSRGTGRFGSPQELSVTRSALKTGPQVITSVPEAGAEIGEGAVLMTISGRPVFLLGGEQPSYRDLGPGATGADVEQLEVALGRIGLPTGAIDGRFDGSTARAVAALYGRAGFRPLVATAGQLSRLRPVEANLGSNRASGGVQLGADEVIFVSDPDLRVSEVTAGIGGAPDGPLMTVSDSQVSIDGSLTLEEAKLVTEGMQVTIDEPALGITAIGTVAQVADRPGTDGVDGFHVFFETVVPDPPATLVGASVRLTIPVKSTGLAVLAVPVSAVSLAPDGSSRVQRSVGGALESVPVEPGVSGDGYVAITARDGAALAPGDVVVIGIQPNGPTNGR